MQENQNTMSTIPLEKQIVKIYYTWCQILNSINLTHKHDIKALIDETPEQDLYKYLNIDEKNSKNNNKVLH